jgi:hypothetical protein
LSLSVFTSFLDQPRDKAFSERDVHQHQLEGVPGAAAAVAGSSGVGRHSRGNESDHGADGGADGADCDADGGADGADGGAYRESTVGDKQQQKKKKKKKRKPSGKASNSALFIEGHSSLEDRERSAATEMASFISAYLQTTKENEKEMSLFGLLCCQNNDDSNSNSNSNSSSAVPPIERITAHVYAADIAFIKDVFIEIERLTKPPNVSSETGIGCVSLSLSISVSVPPVCYAMLCYAVTLLNMLFCRYKRISEAVLHL